MSIVPIPIIPSLFLVEVTGQASSLDAKIDLFNPRKIEKGFIVIEVLGEDGPAIGNMNYRRTAHVTQMPDTVGVIVIGADKKEVKLLWKDAKTISAESMTGLYHIRLQSESNLVGAPVLHLDLTVDTINKFVTGFAAVTQAIESGVLCRSHVLGFYKEELKNKSNETRIIFDLSGYPEIQMPHIGGPGPVLPKNLVATVVFETGHLIGEADYQFLTHTGWRKEHQKIKVV